LVPVPKLKKTPNKHNVHSWSCYIHTHTHTPKTKKNRPLSLCLTNREECIDVHIKKDPPKKKIQQASRLGSGPGKWWNQTYSAHF
jgi:hypothetical protein